MRHLTVLKNSSIKSMTSFQVKGATYIPVMDFKDEYKIYLSLDITNKT